MEIAHLALCWQTSPPQAQSWQTYPPQIWGARCQSYFTLPDGDSIALCSWACWRTYANSTERSIKTTDCLLDKVRKEKRNYTTVPRTVSALESELVSLLAQRNHMRPNWCKNWGNVSQKPFWVFPQKEFVLLVPEPHCLSGSCLSETDSQQPQKFGRKALRSSCPTS